MPHVEGESLRARLNREKQLPLDDALAIAREVADALRYAHNRGVIHRDVKPENIMLESHHALVADFGIARAVSAAGGDRLTETGMAVGTPQYMSPEQGAGEAELDGRSDLYSLGCVLYEMLAGQPPFTGPTAESVVRQHMVVEPPAVTNIRARVPADVVTALRNALAKAPADRQASVSEFAEQLAVARSAETAAAVRSPRRLGGIVAVAILVVVVGILATALGRSRGSAGGEAIRLTVLPFENLGAADDEYFAAGITDEITARLAVVPGLSIIARQSAIQYRNSTKTPQEIGDELGVEYLLEATVSWQRAAEGPSRVRVRPQLIKTSDASHVWANVYDEDLTEVFQVQTRLAEQVVEALGLALLEPERHALEATPTDNLEAYDFYLQGNDYFRRTVSEEKYRIAERLYSRALELDPEFALAYARLSVVHSRLYWYYFERTDSRLSKAKAAADKAVSLAPDLPEAHLALGSFYYMGSLDYDRALQEYALASGGRRDDSELVFEIGAVQRRQGKWAEAAASMDRAAELEPRSATDALQAAITHLYSGSYDAAERHLSRAISLSPDEIRPYVWSARLYLTWQGDMAKARQLLQTADRVAPRDLDPQAWWHWALIRTLEGASPETKHRLTELRSDTSLLLLAAAQVHSLQGRAALARAYYDSARVVLEGRRAARPDEARFRGDLGLAYAGLGRREEALQEARSAVDLLPLSKDALLGTDRIWNLAQVYTMLGMRDEAVEQLEHLLSIPSPLSAHWLRLDPIWEPLRGHAGFTRLLATGK